MTLKSEQIRQEFPVLEQSAYLNTGTEGPLPRRTAQVIAEWTEHQLHEGRSSFKVYREKCLLLLDDLRERFGRLLGAGPDEIAMTHHTTEGMNIAAWGLNWRPGDEIVTTTLEHEGGLLPAYAVARRFGLTIRVVDLGLGEGDCVSKIAAALSPRTRLVVISHVSYVTGAVLPVAEIAGAAHRVGALVAVDGAQSAGAIPVDVHALGVDFYAVPGQKWLCGPEGIGALYVRRERIAELAPTFVGFTSLQDFNSRDLSGYFIPAPGARRFEVGTLFWPALFGMREGLRWLEEDVGLDTVFARGQAITQRFREMLIALPGTTIHSPAAHAGLTTFSVDGLDAAEVPDSLAERGVIIRPVHDPAWLRTSTGFFNNDDDLARLRDGLLALLAEAQAK